MDRIIRVGSGDNLGVAEVTGWGFRWNGGLKDG